MIEVSKTIRVLCVDDHQIVRKGVAAILAEEPDLVLAGEAETATQALAKYRALRPDVTLMDLRLPDATGIEATASIREEFADARIIVLTSYDGDQDIYRALGAGVRGYLLKETVHGELYVPASDGPEKPVVRLGGLLLGQQSNDQQAN